MAKKDYLILHCKAASPGGETTAIRWSHEDKNITNVRGKRLVLHNNSLLIIKIRSREAGNYTCVASNQYGESRSSAVVTVSSECHSMHVIYIVLQPFTEQTCHISLIGSDSHSVSLLNPLQSHKYTFYMEFKSRSG